MINASQDLTPEQKHDLLADSWTKSGFLKYLAAKSPSQAKLGEMREVYETAISDLECALQYKQYWIPAQTYLAMVKLDNGQKDEAFAILKSIIGTQSSVASPPNNTTNAPPADPFAVIKPS